MTTYNDTLMLLRELNKKLREAVKHDTSFSFLNPKHITSCWADMKEDGEFNEKICCRASNDGFVSTYTLKPGTTQQQAEEICELIQLLGCM